MNIFKSFLIGLKKAIKRFIKNIKRFISAPKKITGHLLYFILLFVMNLFSGKKENLPNLGSNHCLIDKITISEEILKRMLSDLNKKNEMNLLEKSFKYYVQKYNMDYLKDVTHAWGFDRFYYINFFDKNFGTTIKKIYGNFNYRIENIWLYKTLNHNNSKSENLNSKFHVDNDAPGALKIIIYLCVVDKNNGPFEYLEEVSKKKISVLGNIGKTIVFNQNKLMHSGSATLNKERRALSFLVFPTPRKKISYTKNKPANAIFTFNPLTKYS